LTPAARVAAIAGVLLLAHAFLLALAQGPACIDDAYISFRYARNLVEGDGLVFNRGDRVEGFTNPGWVLLLAWAQAIGLDLPAVARVLNEVLGLVLVIAAALFVARRSRHPAWAAALAGGLLAADGSLARWSQDGLETVLFTLLLFIATARVARSAPARVARSATARAERSWGGACFGLAAWVRPEGALAFAAAHLWRLHQGGWTRAAWRALLREALVFGAILLPLVLGRLLYYGAWLPNTFHAKVGASAAQVLRGGEYVLRFLLVDRAAVACLVVALLLAHLLAHRAPGPAAGESWRGIFLAVSAAYVLYVTLVGGDWMGHGRFLVPVLPLLYLPLAHAGAEHLGSIRTGPRRASAVVCLLALGGAHLFLSSFLSERRSIVSERAYSASRLMVARFIREQADPDDAILTNEIGQLGWVTGLRTLDAHGLTDPHIARQRAIGMGRGRAGHEKADLAYSFAQRPKWVVIPDIGLAHQRHSDVFPPFADYQTIIVPDTTPRPEYQLVLRRRDPSPNRP
jgi:hypothetical protein